MIAFGLWTYKGQGIGILDHLPRSRQVFIESGTVPSRHLRHLSLLLGILLFLEEAADTSALALPTPTPPRPAPARGSSSSKSPSAAAPGERAALLLLHSPWQLGWVHRFPRRAPPQHSMPTGFRISGRGFLRVEGSRTASVRASV